MSEEGCNIAGFELTDVVPIFEGPHSRVVRAQWHEQLVVLKQVSDPAQVAAEAAALQHYKGHGAVRLLHHSTHALLIDFVDPGTPLTSLVLDGQDDEATRALVDVARRLHNEGARLGIQCIPEWHSRYEVFREQIGVELFDRGQALYRELAASQQQPVVLHGDLHHDNILRDDERGWIAIDPKGYLGERAYEYGCLLRNPTTDPKWFAHRNTIERRIELVARRTGHPAARILAWGFAQGLLSAIWSLEDGENPMRGLATAAAIEPLLPPSGWE